MTTSCSSEAERGGARRVADLAAWASYGALYAENIGSGGMFWMVSMTIETIWTAARQELKKTKIN